MHRQLNPAQRNNEELTNMSQLLFIYFFFDSMKKTLVLFQFEIFILLKSSNVLIVLSMMYLQ